jgi:phosphoribosylformylglycinamidine synthase
MTVAVAPEHIDRFLELSRKHAVESTVIGRYTDTGKLHILYEGETCAYVDLKLLTAGFPQWEFEARWLSPEHRGLCEPAMRPPVDHTRLLLDMLERPNICSKEWITRQYDHEVQGTSVVKPLLGPMRDVPGDAAVLRPRLDSRKGLAFAQALLPQYSAIDAYHMTACTMDEAVRRLIAVGADPAHMGGVDNFCWPDIQAHPETNPDGAFKAAQLVRSCRALKAICLSYGIPLLSGKDSMYVDGYLAGRYGEFHKVSALETLQFSAVSVVEDIEDCVTPDPKSPGDLLYVLGVTRNELGGSEYYERFGYIGKNVPQVRPESFLPLYRSLHHAMGRGLVESAHGVYRGGLAVHLAMVAMAGGLGLHADLTAVTVEGSPSEEQILYSESAGRFIVTIAPENRDAFEAAMAGHPVACVGRITEDDGFILRGVDETERVSTTVAELREVWKRPFGDLI